MKKSELRELYKMMFPDYPDIVTVRQLMEMLGVSRTLAYSLINDGDPGRYDRSLLQDPEGQCH